MTRLALVTGATRGIGRAVALRLAGSGAQVLLAVRDMQKGEAVAAEIRAARPDARAIVLGADLSRLGDVERLAQAVAAGHPDLDLLVNNAGVSKFRRVLTEDGLETTFAVNHLAPFLLTNLLLDVLERNGGKVVTVSSEMHRFVRAIPWDDLQSEGRFRPLDVYALTKLYGILFTRELARRVRHCGVVANCLSPGFSRTDLSREADGWFGLFMKLNRPFQKPPDIAATEVVGAAGAAGSGLYLRAGRVVEPSRLACDKAAASRLWEVSEGLLGAGGARHRLGAVRHSYFSRGADFAPASHESEQQA